MPLPDDLRLKLVAALDNDSLMFLLGAGLSMPAPSFLPSAERVAKVCFDKWSGHEDIDANFQYDVDKLAGLFHSRGALKSIFIPLVPWNELAGAPNRGHGAVADLLITRAAHGALSANFDTMIERWAAQNKIAMLGALTGQEAVDFAAVSNPLLKFHGCMNRGKSDTLWTQGQLGEADVQARIATCAGWMNLHLPGKHLVVVGFWTDWGYLNDVIADAFQITTAQSVTVIDPSDDATLEGKAPKLWEKLHALSGSFVHIQASGDEVLEELRVAYSRSWAKKFYAHGKAMCDESGIGAVVNADACTMDELYDMRRDAEGLPYTHAATVREPPAGYGETAFAHAQLVAAGGTRDGAWFTVKGKRVRVVNGQGRSLATMKERHREPTSLPAADIVMCVGAVDLGVPSRLIATGKGTSVVSAAPGGGADWMTREKALEELAS